VTGARAQSLVIVPDAHVTYLGGTERPEGTEGLKEVPPAGATAILFKGGFSFGAAGILQEALDAAPKAHLVAFDSPGGRPLVADQIATLIRARHLDTYVERYCASACTVAFVAGTVRSANPKAKFGFHLAASIAFEGLSSIEFVRMERRWFVRGGVSLSFGNRAMHAPNRSPYLPPLDELIAAGYLHRIHGFSGAAVTTRTGEGNQLFAEMRLAEPQTTAILLASERRRVALGMAPDRARAIALDDAALVADRFLSRSSDKAILGFVGAAGQSRGGASSASARRASPSGVNAARDLRGRRYSDPREHRGATWSASTEPCCDAGACIR
jgi:hypothetical protein